MFDENNQLIQAIADFQKRGKSQDCLHYQQMLHRNLMYLTSMTNSAASVNQLLPPPTQSVTSQQQSTVSSQAMLMQQAHSQLQQQHQHSHQHLQQQQHLQQSQHAPQHSQQPHNSLHTQNQFVPAAGPQHAVPQAPTAYTPITYSTSMQPPIAQPAPSAAQHHYTHPNAKVQYQTQTAMYSDTATGSTFPDEQPPTASNTLAAQNYTFQMTSTGAIPHAPQPTTIQAKEQPMIIKEEDLNRLNSTQPNASNELSAHKLTPESNDQISPKPIAVQEQLSASIENLKTESMSESVLNAKNTSFDGAFTSDSSPNDRRKNVQITPNHTHLSGCSPTGASVGTHVSPTLPEAACNSDSLDALEPSLPAEYTTADVKEQPLPSFQTVSAQDASFVNTFPDTPNAANCTQPQYQYAANTQIVTSSNPPIATNNLQQASTTTAYVQSQPPQQVYQLPNGSYVSAAYNPQYVQNSPNHQINAARSPNLTANQNSMSPMILANPNGYANSAMANSPQFSNGNAMMNQANAVQINAAAYTQQYPNTFAYGGNGTTVSMQGPSSQAANPQWFNQTQIQQQQQVAAQQYISNQQAQMTMQNQSQYQMHVNASSPQQMQLQLQQHATSVQTQPTAQQQSNGQTYVRTQGAYGQPGQQINYAFNSPKAATSVYSAKTTGFPGQHQFAAQSFAGNTYGATHFMPNSPNSAAHQSQQQQQMITSSTSNNSSNHGSSMSSPQQANPSQWFVQ
jgi:hypothetical protein